MKRNSNILLEAFLACLSLCSPYKCSSTTQCKTHQYMINKKILHHVSFHIYFTRSPSTYVCFNQTFLCESCLSLPPVSTLGKHSFTCLPQGKNREWWLFWLSKEPSSFHFRVGKQMSVDTVRWHNYNGDRMEERKVDGSIRHWNMKNWSKENQTKPEASPVVCTFVFPKLTC